MTFQHGHLGALGVHGGLAGGLGGRVCPRRGCAEAVCKLKPERCPPLSPGFEAAPLKLHVTINTKIEREQQESTRTPWASPNVRFPNGSVLLASKALIFFF